MVHGMDPVCAAASHHSTVEISNTVSLMVRHIFRVARAVKPAAVLKSASRWGAPPAVAVSRFALGGAETFGARFGGEPMCDAYVLHPNSRPPRKANKGKRPCSHVARRKKRPRRV
jgi:hypothetical protein